MATKTGVWNLQQVRDKQLQELWGYSGTAAERTNLWMWGANSYGTLGQNTQGGWSPDAQYLTAQSSPIQVPGDYLSVTSGSTTTLLVNTDNEMYVMGRNDYGQLGLNSRTDYSSPTQVPGTTWNKTGMMYRSAAAVKTDGTLWTWGRNEYGEGGLNNIVAHSSPTQVPGTTWSTNKKHVSGSYGNFAFIKTDGTAWMTGKNNTGQAGTNNHNNGYSSPVQIPGTNWDQIDGGNDNIFAVKTDGTLWSWGYGYGGTLGHNVGAPVKLSSPTQIPGTSWNSVAGGKYFAFATRTDGTLYSWGGSNNYGQLGLNERAVLYSSPTQIPGTTWSWVICSAGSVFATKTDGTLWAWGDNQAGENGQGDRGGYSGTPRARSSPTQVPGTWTLDPVGMAGIPGRFAMALKS